LKKLSTSNYFEQVPFILFLNKIDLFREKINVSPLSQWFPEYDEWAKNQKEKDTYKQGIDFLKNSFLSRFQGKKNIYCFETCALDTEQCTNIFDSIRDQVLFRNFDEAGL